MPKAYTLPAMFQTISLDYPNTYSTRAVRLHVPLAPLQSLYALLHLVDNIKQKVQELRSNEFIHPEVEGLAMQKSVFKSTSISKSDSAK